MMPFFGICTHKKTERDQWCRQGWNYLASARRLVLFISLSHCILLSFSLPESDNNKGDPHYLPDHEFVSGKSVEYLPDPIFYDTYIPILFKIPVPKHTEKALKLNWGNVKDCEKSSKGKLCPVVHPMFQVIKKLRDDMGFWKPYYVNHTSTKKESAKRKAGFEVICNEIGAHFVRSYTSKPQLEAYMKALRACSRIGPSIQLTVADESWVVDKTVYYQMLDNFVTEYFNDLPLEGKADWAITLNAYTSIHGHLLTNHVLESVRLASALRICQGGMIPETFLSMDLLKQELHKIGDNLGRWNYQLVYNNLDQDVEEYYKLPLADCTFSDEYSFVIRILAPVRRSEIYHKLVEINTIPFLEKLSNTSGIPQRLCRLRLPTSKLTLIETSTGLLLDTHCEPNQLCKTSEVSTVFENDACTAALLTDNRQLISNTCKFSCFVLDSIALPLIRRIASDTYVVVGGSDIKIHINCYDNPSNMIPIPLKDVGALRIKLACSCHILYLNHVVYRPREPCLRKTTVEHILPYHWYTKQLNDTLDNYKYDIEGHLPSEHNNKSPSVNFTGDDTDFTVANNSNSDSLSGIGDEQIEKSIAAQEEELEDRFSQKPDVEKVHRCDGMSDGLIVQLCLMWILLILFGVTILHLGCQLHKLRKWRELQSYKDTRIFYTVPDTPDENKINQKNRIRSGTRVLWDSFYDLFRGE